MRRVQLWGGLIFLATTAASPSLLAQPGAGVANAQAGAATHHDLGRAAQKKGGDWRVAYDEYAKAYALYQHPQILISLAVAEIHLGKYRDAASHLTRFLAAPPLTLSTEERAAYEKSLIEVKKHV